jgi:hypothetical protein
MGTKAALKTPATTPNTGQFRGTPMALTPDIIEVFITIDAEAIIAQYGRGGSATAPTPIAHQDDRIFMVAAKSNVVSGFGTSELNVRCRTGQTVVVASAPLQPVEYAALLRGCRILSGGDYLSQDPVCEAVQRNTMAMQPGRNPQDHIVQQTAYFDRWRFNPVAKGTITYNFQFQVYDNTSTPTDLGWFVWDPFITVTL